MPEPTDPAFPLERIREVGDAIVASVSTVIDGKTEAIRTALTVMLAEGHLLVEDVPGVGKTVLAKALGASVGGSVNRIQFTSDMLPSDVTGVNIFDQSSGTFRFSPGPVFANVVIGDEINRTSPKTQSALLEAMAESQVTVDGVTRLLDRPFMIVATQNPIDMEGTYPLPEAQRDRFMARITMGYPSVDAERQMLANRGGGDPLSHLRPIVDVSTLRGIIEAVANVHIAPDVEAYVIAIVRSTRTHPDLVLGASPGPRCTWPRRPVPTRRCSAGRSSRRTTSPRWHRSCSPTGSCRWRADSVARARTPCARSSSASSPTPPCRSRRPPSAPDARPIGTVVAAAAHRCRALDAGALRPPWAVPAPAHAVPPSDRARLDRHRDRHRADRGGLVGTTSVAVSAGLLLLVLVVLGIVMAFVVAAPLRGSRSTARAIVQVGEVYRERITLGSTSLPIGPRSTLLVREQLEDAFASASEAETYALVGPGLPPAVLDVEALAMHRGRTLVGPVTIRVEDPFGLLRIDRPVVPAEEVVVVPASAPLAAIDTGALAGAVSADEGRVGQGGSADDSELRPYRPGDPIRRVHWAQSARRGELHVRQTTQAQPPEAVIALDVRRESYQGLGREDLAELSDLGGDQAFEHAVVVAASVARALAARTSRVVLVSDGPSGSTRHAGDVGGLTDVLVGLADVRLRSDARPVTEVLPEVRGRDVHGMTAVVTGNCTAEQAAELVTATSGSSRGIMATIVPPDPVVRGILDRGGWRTLVVPVAGATASGAAR
ncbi:AAA family ATPase [Sphingomonas sp. LR61]